jgi:hypothetical protein
MSTNYPLDANPSNYLSARFLATTVINKSNCVNLESMDKKRHDVFLFSCQKYNDVLESSYTIYIFSTTYSKKLFFKTTKEKSIFKAGKYFLIEEDYFYGDSKNNIPRPITINSYDGFNGEIIFTKK